MQRAWVVPKNNRSVLVARSDEHGYRDGAPRLVDVGAVPMPPLAPHALDLAADLLVFAEKHTLSIVRGLTTTLQTTRTPLPWSEVHALLHVDGVVYVGGVANHEMLGVVDLRDQARFRPIPIPDDIHTFGKAIDGFALHGHTLVAVDDLVFPRYYLTYDVTDARSPRFLGARSMPVHNSGEHVVSVASNDHLLAILATGANRGRVSLHLSIVDLPTLAELAVFEAYTDHPFLPSRHLPDFTSISILRNTLLIAAGAAGIALLDLTPYLPGQDPPVPRPKTPSTIPSRALRFVPAGEARTIQVIPVHPGTAFAVSVTETGLSRKRTYSSTLVHLG